VKSAASDKMAGLEAAFLSTISSPALGSTHRPDQREHRRQLGRSLKRTAHLNMSRL
jgi:hypothetical protein